MTINELVTVIFGSAGGAYTAIWVHLKYHRRDIDKAHKRLDEHDRQIYEIKRCSK